MLEGTWGPPPLRSPGLVSIVVMSLLFIGEAAAKAKLSYLPGAGLGNRAFSTGTSRTLEDPGESAQCREDPEAQPLELWT